MSAILLTFMLSNPSAPGQPIVAVRPTTIITHDVEIANGNGRDYREIELVGPRFYGTFHIDDPDAPEATTPITYAWYKITSPAPKSQTFTGNCQLGARSYTLGRARFLLMPAITLAGNKVASKQDTGNMMVAVDLIPSGDSPQGPNMPRMICLPVGQRHHREISAVRPQQTVFIVQKSSDGQESGTIGLIDQFGLHQCKQLHTAYAITPIAHTRLFPSATDR